MAQSTCCVLLLTPVPCYVDMKFNSEDCDRSEKLWCDYSAPVSFLFFNQSSDRLGPRLLTLNVKAAFVYFVFQLLLMCLYHDMNVSVWTRAPRFHLLLLEREGVSATLNCPAVWRTE